MRMFALIASFLVASLCFAEEPFRLWTNLDGRKIKARFIEGTKGQVSVRRTDGRTFKIPLDNLSEEDRIYVKSLTFDPTDGLVAWYPFNGNAQDESGNGHHGKVIGATLCKDRKGNPDSAYNFDGVNDYVRIEDKDQMNPVSFTVSCWYYGTKSFAGAGTNVLVVKSFTKHIAPFYQWILLVGGDEYTNTKGKYRDGNFLFGVIAMAAGNSQVSIDKKNVISLWNQIVGVVDLTLENSRLYMNGILKTENKIKYTGFNAFSTDIYIAKHGNLDELRHFTPGHIDDVRIYNKALSANQIKSLYELEK